MKKTNIKIMLILTIALIIFASCGKAQVTSISNEKDPADLEMYSFQHLEDINSSTALTQFDKDLQDSSGSADTIYARAFNELDQAFYHPYGGDYNEDEKATFIRNYLLALGIDEDVSPEVIYNAQGDLLAEYYITDDNTLN